VVGRLIDERVGLKSVEELLVDLLRVEQSVNGNCKRGMWSSTKRRRC